MMVSSHIIYDNNNASQQYKLDMTARRQRVLAPLQEFTRLKIDTREPNMPVLYVAMATWIPKCNMYQLHSEPEIKGKQQPESPLENQLDQSTCDDSKMMKASELNAPELKTTDLNAPELNAPELSAPELNETELKTTNLNASELKAPELKASDLNATNLNATNLNATNLNATDLNATDLNATDLNTTDLNATDLNATDLNSTDLNATDLNVTDLNTSELNASELNMSSTSDSKSASKKSQKQSEIEKRRLEKQMKKQEKDKEREKKEEEKMRLKEEKARLKEEKEQQKSKEKLEKLKEKEMKEEQRRKEKEEKEQKRKEKEQKEEQRRKEKEQEKLKRQIEIHEKNKEKQRIEEKKQKAVAAFVNFFVPKKPTEANNEKLQPQGQELETNVSNFMPFEIKNDMRLAPLQRRTLTEEEKANLMEAFEKQLGANGLNELKTSKRKSENTWSLVADNSEDNDVILIENDEDVKSVASPNNKSKVRAKFLHFHENQRPPYFGTWRKMSNSVKGRKPFGKDLAHIDYDIDSDEEWEDADSGESLRGSDEEEDKENDSGNEYVEDDDFFVPHGHLSEDELDDENEKFSPESHKFKLKLLKNEFDEEVMVNLKKMVKVKPRIIGCIWYGKDNLISDTAIDDFLKPFAILYNENAPMVLKQRNYNSDGYVKINTSNSSNIQLDKETLRDFVKLINGNTNKRKRIVEEYQKKLLEEKNLAVSKISLSKFFKSVAEWKKSEEIVMNNKKTRMHWSVDEKYKKEYSI